MNYNDNDLLTKPDVFARRGLNATLIEERKFLTDTEINYVLSRLPEEGKMLTLEGLNLNWGIEEHPIEKTKTLIKH